MNKQPSAARWPQGIKKTKQRAAVLAELEKAEAPLTAQELSVRLQQAGEEVWLSTIYRILDTFVQNGIVTRTTVLNSGTAVYELAGEQHRHYAVCLLCGKVTPMENCPLESFLPRLSDREFHVLGHRLQMFGYCGGCVCGANAKDAQAASK